MSFTNQIKVERKGSGIPPTRGRNKLLFCFIRNTYILALKDMVLSDPLQEHTSKKLAKMTTIRGILALAAIKKKPLF